jgi:hypothetical protein
MRSGNDTSQVLFFDMERGASPASDSPRPSASYRISIINSRSCFSQILDRAVSKSSVVVGHADSRLSGILNDCEERVTTAACVVHEGIAVVARRAKIARVGAPPGLNVYIL